MSQAPLPCLPSTLASSQSSTTFSFLLLSAYRAFPLPAYSSPPSSYRPDATVERGIGEALMRDFSILPIVEKRRPVGYLNVPEMQQAMAEGRVEGGEAISNAMRVFERSVLSSLLVL